MFACHNILCVRTVLTVAATLMTSKHGLDTVRLRTVFVWFSETGKNISWKSERLSIWIKPEMEIQKSVWTRHSNSFGFLNWYYFSRAVWNSATKTRQTSFTKPNISFFSLIIKQSGKLGKISIALCPKNDLSRYQIHLFGCKPIGRDR